MICIGPWSGDGQTRATAWRAPPGCTAAIDLRSNAGQGAPGAGLFELPATPGGQFVALGDGPLDTVNAARRTVLSDRTGAAVTALRLGGAVRQILGANADPTGIARVKPLQSGPGRAWSAHLGAATVRVALAEDDPAWLAHVALLRAEYARLRALSLLAPADDSVPFPAAIRRTSHRRWLAKMRLRYGLASYLPLLGGLPDEGELEPETSFTDSFDVADSDTVGDGGWTERLGDFDNASNRATQTTGTGGIDDVCHRTTWAGGADYFVESICRITGGSWQFDGIALRRTNFGATDNDYYAIFAAFANYPLYKRVSGSWTELSNPTATLNADTDYVFKIDGSGSTLNTWLDGGAKSVDVTDTAISAAGDPAMITSGASSRSWFWDDFTADDGAGGGLSIPIAMHHYKQIAGVN